MTTRHFDKVMARYESVAHEETEAAGSEEPWEGVYQHLAMAYQAAGFDPDDSDQRDAFVKFLRKVTEPQVVKHLKKLTSTKARGVMAATKAALK